MSKLQSVTVFALSSLLSLGIGISSTHAADPCLQSPESVNQGSAPRCASSVCGIDCFQCPQILAAAAGCGGTTDECPKPPPPDTSCTKIKPVEATLNIGTLDSKGCPTGGSNAWALKTSQGTAYLTVLCDKGNVQTIQNVVFVDSTATASGELCKWSYKNLSVVATWSEGKTPTLSIGGFNKAVIINDLKVASLGSSVTFAGSAQAPLSDGSGYHSRAPISMTISAAGACDCSK